MKRRIAFPLLRLLGHQRWLRVGIRNRICRAFLKPDGVVDFPFTKPFFGFRYRGNLRSTIDWTVYFFGVYERSEIEFITQLPGATTSTILDIGANVGHHTLAFAAHYHHVHSFEPYPVVREVLSQRIIDNNIGNVTIHPFGVSNQDDRLRFYPPGERNLGTGSFVSGHAQNNPHDSDITLEVIVGDSYVQRENFTNIGAIKIDIEGFERQALEGLHDTLEKFRPYVVMEYSSSTRASFVTEADFRALLPKDYEIRTMEVDRRFAVLFNRPQCQLTPFNFKREQVSLLLYPKERPVNA
ncbi:MAG: FkbM family methyltransferase [Pseudomonadota bacterium]